MSIECRECERDLRCGHDPSCSRYRANWQIPVTYEASGYITVNARTAADAKLLIRNLVVQMDFSGCDANTDLMPETPSLMITGKVEKVEDDDDEV